MGLPFLSLQDMDPEKGCALRYAQQMVEELSSSVRRQYSSQVCACVAAGPLPPWLSGNPLQGALNLKPPDSHPPLQLHSQTGSISRIEQQDGGWRLDDLALAKEVFLCTGSHPRTETPGLTGGSPLPSSLRTLSLDDMLKPSRIPWLVRTLSA